METLTLRDGNPKPYHVIRMPGVGSCLFHAISYSIHGHMDSNGDVMSNIIQYVVEHWDQMEVLTCNELGERYTSPQAYKDTMINPSTYGSLSEVKAAGCVYPFTFEVYTN